MRAIIITVPKSSWKERKITHLTYEPKKQMKYLH